MLAGECYSVTWFDSVKLYITRKFSSLEEFGQHHVTKGLSRISEGVITKGNLLFAR